MSGRYRVEAEAKYRVPRPDCGPEAYQYTYDRMVVPYGKSCRRTAAQARQMLSLWLATEHPDAVEHSVATMNGGSGVVEYLRREHR